ncbi:carbon-nitrogen hydrolase family protein [Plebeiibacterium sediminum]|uniref:Carbon-nitrogen hydrolase family protein n=1 Tax=Plebeiibacterium sediminum TaxID=2992112 RepID=A0AAE3M932_9BACT|nr:carbon-nitrogen hydrolase family protein [Plebeiobacterium sediminum]MCW3789174.1 carbon-nitrogen hydrolase family protein [Plebeiobacterium sediminum]
MLIACAHTLSEPLNLKKNLSNIEKYLKLFDQKKVCYALFPEMSVSGYFNSEEELSEYRKHYEDILSSILTLSKKYSLHFAVGMPIFNNAKWYIAQVIYKNGEIIDLHFKTHLSENEKRVFSEGNQLNSINTGIITTGFQICLENHFPELTSILQKQGAQLISAPFASPRETPEEKLKRISAMLQTRAYDNCCFIMACNTCGTTKKSKPYAGFSIIISPRGKVITSRKGYQQGFCIADIDLHELTQIKNSKMGYFPGFKRTDWIKTLK